MMYGQLNPYEYFLSLNWKTARNSRRKLQNNTYVYKETDEEGQPYFKLKLHNTFIGEYYSTYYILNDGGWRTITTKDRLNNYSTISIWQKNYVWYWGSEGKKWIAPLKLYYNGSEATSPSTNSVTYGDQIDQLLQTLEA